MEACQSGLNDIKPKQPVPVPKGGYFCSPYTFFVLALFKLVLSLGILAIIFHTLFLSFVFSRSISLFNVLLWIAFFIDAVDIGIGFIIIISVCKKNQEIMKVYYTFSIYVFGTLTVFCCLIFYMITKSIQAVLIFFCIFVLVLMMQMFLCHMVKSEVLKLRNNEQSRLIDNEPEQQCTHTKNVDT